VVRANFPRTPPGGHKVSWRERLQALRHLPKLFRMVWDTNPGYVVGIILLRVVRAEVPIAVLWVRKFRGR
jgi:ATP-binding cassette subfamily B protein